MRTRAIRRLLGVTVGISGLADPMVPARAQAPAATPIVINATVTDSSSRYVTDLTAADFAVIDEGAPQTVTAWVRATDMPANIALVLDSSNSTQSTHGIVQEAALKVVRKLRAGDLAEIVDFDSRVTVVQPFTDESTKLEAAIRKLAVGGSSSLFNAVYITLRDFRKTLESAKRRHVMIVISDGEDTSSLLKFEEVLGGLRHSNVTIYTIRVPSTDPRAPRRDNTMVMQMLAKESGGQALTAYSARDLDKITDTISGDLANQYSLEFTPGQTVSNRALHRLVVSVSRANATVRARLSYDASPSR